VLNDTRLANDTRHREKSAKQAKQAAGAQRNANPPWFCCIWFEPPIMPPVFIMPPPMPLFIEPIEPRFIWLFIWLLAE
jgi:hypothetical protein